MNEFMACPQCQGVMILEDLEEVSHSGDVEDFFGYQYLACGHKEESTPSLLGDLEQIYLDNRLMKRQYALAKDVS